MTNAAKILGSVAIIAMGIAGLHYGVEYSGWVLFIGCFCALGSI